MAMQPPPPRYRVVEQGRRLVVIDTRTEFPIRITSVAAGVAHRSTWTDRVARTFSLILSAGAKTHEGHPIVTTKPFYDDHAPRELVLDPAAQRRIGAAVTALTIVAGLTAIVVVPHPIVTVVLLPLFSGVVQGRLRRRVTDWLDQIATASSAG